MSKLNTDFVVLVFSMSIVLVMGINTTSINIAIALDRGELTELWVAKVTGFSSQYNTGRYVATVVNTIRCLSSYKYFFTQLVS